MGDPRKARKQYEKPMKAWDKTKIITERKILDDYGLKNKHELRRMEGILRQKRQNGRALLALQAEARQKKEKEMMDSLIRMGIMRGSPTLDDVLSLKIQDILERRLNTIVFRKNLANTMKQARQLIVHGHIALNGKKITAPSYIVKDGEEDKIGFLKREIRTEAKQDKVMKGKKGQKQDEVKQEFEAIGKDVAAELKKEDQGKVTEEMVEQVEAATPATTATA